jgi:hypothetical protein
VLACSRTQIPYSKYLGIPRCVHCCSTSVTICYCFLCCRLCRTSDSTSLPNDYISVDARCDSINFAANDEIKEHNINVNDDTWGEQEYKIFTISINNTDPGVTFNDTTSYNVTIHDNDSKYMTYCLIHEQEGFIRF